MKAVIQSDTHRVQLSLATVLAGANLATTIVEAKQPSDVSGGSTEVPIGTIVKAVYVELWVRAGDTSPGSTLATLVKTPDAQTISFADQADLYAYKNRKNILYHTQGLTNDQDADAIPFIRQWFKIPKGKQRFGWGDRLILGIAAQALDNIVCGHMIFKAYS